MTGQKFAIKSPKPKKRRVNWHMVIIGDNGKVIHFPRYKFCAVLMLLLLCLSIASAFWLFRLFQDSHRKNKILAESMLELEKAVDDLKKENEMLVARLVMGGIDLNPERNNEKNNPSGGEAEPEKRSPIGTGNTQGPKREIEYSHGEKQGTVTEASFFDKRPEKPGLVAVTDVTVTHQSEHDRLDVKFKLSNISNRTVSGYLFMILKNKKESPDSWIILPEKFLDRDGIPSNYGSGHAFKISRFKNIKFTVQYHENLGKYFTADILVFNKNGKIRFKQEFPIKI